MSISSAIAAEYAEKITGEAIKDAKRMVRELEEPSEFLRGAQFVYDKLKKAGVFNE